MAGFVNLLAALIGADGAGTTQNTTQAAINALAVAVSNAINGVTGGRGVVQVLGQSTGPVSVTGTLTETVLATIPVPALAMGLTGALRVSASYSYTNSANNKQILSRFGGVAFRTSTRTTAAQDNYIDMVRNRGAANSQFVALSLTAASVVSGVQNTLAVDTTVTQNLTLSATLTNVGETITLEGYTVELILL